MSHFAVLVVGTDVDYQLAPFHEFECTGRDDEFIQEVDVTEDWRAEWESYKQLTSDPHLSVFCAEYNIGIVGLGGTPDTSAEGTEKYTYIRVQEDGTFTATHRTNPNAKWDWYVVGGRASNWLLLKDGSKVDSARFGDIDFAGIADEAEAKALVKLDKTEAIVEEHGNPMSWGTILEQCGEDLQAARQKYNDQPTIKALYAAGLTLRGRDIVNSDGFTDFDREAFIAKTRAESFQAFAFVKDRKWAQRGEMGWWACVSNEKTDWPEIFQKLLAEIGPDEIVTIVDCHI
jgi:hypothetical protein